jgi:molybdopterin-guanine dinucleotide biosynthesis protein A
MGGRPKGLLEIDGETIVARWRRIFGSLDVPCVLVGANDAYAHLEMTTLPDLGSRGPIAGLASLIGHAKEVNASHAIAVACDMPYASAALLRRLIDAPPATIVAPRVDDMWQPFFARYAVGVRYALESARLQDVLDAARATELSITPDEARELRDWDTPADQLL